MTNPDPVTQRRLEATRRTMLRIAELQIKRFGLKCTPQEYVAKCQQNMAEKMASNKASK